MKTLLIAVSFLAVLFFVVSQTSFLKAKTPTTKPLDKKNTLFQEISLKEGTRNLDIIFRPTDVCGLSTIDAIRMDSDLNRQSRWMLSFEQLGLRSPSARQHQLIDPASLAHNVEWSITLPNVPGTYALQICRDSSNANTCLNKSSKANTKSMADMLQANAGSNKSVGMDLVYYSLLFYVDPIGKVRIPTPKALSNEFFFTLMPELTAHKNSPADESELALALHWAKSIADNLGPPQVDHPSPSRIELDIHRYSQMKCN